MFYRGGDDIMAVRVETEPAFRAGAPQRLFGGNYLSGFGIQYDIPPDGQQFLMITLSGATADTDDLYGGLTQLQVVQNWFTELQARVPTGR